MESVKVLFIRGCSGPSGFCLTRKGLTFLHKEAQVAFKNRTAALGMQVQILASKRDQFEAVSTITRARPENARERGCPSMRAFEALIEMLDVLPNLQGEPPLTIAGTLSGWGVFAKTDAVATVRLMVECSGRDPMQFALHSARIVEGHPVSLAGPL